MVLTPKQKTDLNKAILGYLQKQGYGDTCSKFKEESALREQDLQQVESERSKFDELLEKKWTSVVRLQKKLEGLQNDLKSSQKEVSSLGTARGQSNAKDRSNWLPRAPAAYSLAGHHKSITACAFHPIYTQCVTASEDATIRVWNYEHGNFDKSLKGHTDSVNSLDYLKPPFETDVSKQGKRLASASADMTIKIWDVDDNYKCIKTLRGHEHNVSCVRFMSNNSLCSASRDSTVKIWKLDTGFCIATLPGHLCWVRTLAPSPCGNFLATGSKDQSVRIWAPVTANDWTTAKAKMTLEGHSNDVEDVCWANKESYPSLELTDVAADGTQAKMTNGGTGDCCFKYKYVASASRDKTIMIWDITTQQCFITLAGHDNWVRGLAFHPHGKYLLSVSDDKSIRSWFLATRSNTKSVECHGHFIQCIDIHHSSKHVITGSVDKVLMVWDCR